MCGIIACLSLFKDVKTDIVDGLHQLRNRGFDSCGVVCVDRKCNVLFTKSASVNSTSDSLQIVADTIKESDRCCMLGIGHTRWATHGGVSTKNSHPHSSGNSYAVHNGIIENHHELKKMLEGFGFQFTSETDSEVVPVLMDYFRKHEKIDSPFDCFKKTIELLRGTWAIVAVDSEFPDRFFVARHGSPILVGVTDSNDTLVVTSEVSAFCGKVDRFRRLADSEILEISINENKIEVNGELLKDSVKLDVSSSSEDDKKLDVKFTSWTEKEIKEQPRALSNSLNPGRLSSDGTVTLGGLETFKKQLSFVKHLVLSGCGTSLNAAMFAAKLFRKTRRFKTVTVIDAGEFADEDLPNVEKGKIAMIVVSQSGETKDLVRVLDRFKDVATIGVVNTVGSLISESTKCGVFLNAGREIGVASTKSFTCQVAILLLISEWFSSSPLSIELLNLSSVFSENMVNLELQALDSVVDFVEASTCFVLGRSLAYPIALEAALKLKELTYKSVEGHAAGSLKHGPFSIIDEKTLVFIISIGTAETSKTSNTVEEILSRQGRVKIITNVPHEFSLKFQDKKTVEIITVDCKEQMSATLVSVLYFQHLSIAASSSLKNDCDFPRNLAKCVTVD